MNSECWLWALSKDKAGYGKITLKDVNQVMAHRVIYEALVGDIPPGLYVCHRCDTPPCINPEHLFLGTALDNMRDMVQKGRGYSHHKNQTHCIRGHEFNEINTDHRPNGKRECRICNRDRQRVKQRLRRSQNVTNNPS